VRTLNGWVSGSGYGRASQNYAHLKEKISARVKIGELIDGTLNVRLPSAYTVRPDAIVEAHEYNGQETLKLQRCVVAGIPCVIVRPTTHEGLRPIAHGPAHVELMSGAHLTSSLGLQRGAAVDVEIEGDEMWWRAAQGSNTQ
jgi:CTP-dependent riboflavin kinase